MTLRKSQNFNRDTDVQFASTNNPPATSRAL
jgi:hypothetical protein